MKRRSKTNKIILHCSATPEGHDFRASDIRRWHKQLGWEDIGYHYVIDIDGTVEEGRPVEYVGAHCSGHNSDSIGVCYIGGCSAEPGSKLVPKDTRTQRQKDAMLDLIFLLLERYKLTIDDVYCHNNFTKLKACPSFKIEDFRKEYIKEYEVKD